MAAMDGVGGNVQAEISAAAARLVVEEGLEFGPAKRRAVKLLGLPMRSALPGNDKLEEAVREYIALFCADSQERELFALRGLALLWMERLAPFRPHLAGAVWRGTATRNSDIHLQLFCDDPKSAEIALIDARVNYWNGQIRGLHGRVVDVLSIQAQCAELATHVGVQLSIYDHNDLRGALRPDSGGSAPRGDLQALRARMLVAQQAVAHGL